MIQTSINPSSNFLLSSILLFIIIIMFVSVSAKGFEYDHLYVTAHLELPECKLADINKYAYHLICLLHLVWEIEDKDYSISPRSQLPVVITQICSKHKVSYPSMHSPNHPPATTRGHLC